MLPRVLFQPMIFFFTSTANTILKPFHTKSSSLKLEPTLECPPV